MARETRVSHQDRDAQKKGAQEPEIVYKDNDPRKGRMHGVNTDRGSFRFKDNHRDDRDK